MSLFDAAGQLDVPAEAREVFDVTGAGDTVIATLAAMLACGLAPARRDADRQPRRRHRRRQVRHRERRATRSCSVGGSAMKVVVTGAAGMIGSNLVHGLNAHRHRRRDRRRRPDRRAEVPQPARRAAQRLLRPQRVLRALRARRARQGRRGAARGRLLRHDGARRPLHARHQLPLLEGPARRLPGAGHAPALRVVGGHLRRQRVVPRGARVRAAAQRLRLLEAAVRQRRAAHAADGQARRSPAFATSTSTARASSTRAAWRRSRSTTSTQFRADRQGQAVRRVRRLRAGRADRATSSSSTTSSRSTCGSSSTRQASGIFNLGTGRAQPFNDVARRDRQRARALSAARRRCRSTSWSRTASSSTSISRRRWSASTSASPQADLTRLRAVGCEHAFADVATGVRATSLAASAALKAVNAPLVDRCCSAALQSRSRDVACGCPTHRQENTCSRNSSPSLSLFAAAAFAAVDVNKADAGRPRIDQGHRPDDLDARSSTSARRRRSRTGTT